MSSKFWNRGVSASSSEDSDASDSDGSSGAPVRKVVEKSWVAVDESSSEEERRVMRSEKEKITDEIKRLFKAINTHKKKDEYTEIYECKPIFACN